MIKRKCKTISQIPNEREYYRLVPSVQQFELHILHKSNSAVTSFGLHPSIFYLTAVTSASKAPQLQMRLDDLSRSPCSRRPCHPGVRCVESTHISAGFVCGPCPPGLHGDGRTCAAAGRLEAGPAQSFCFQKFVKV